MHCGRQQNGNRKTCWTAAGARPAAQGWQLSLFRRAGGPCLAVALRGSGTGSVTVPAVGPRSPQPCMPPRGWRWQHVRRGGRHLQCDLVALGLGAGQGGHGGRGGKVALQVPGQGLRLQQECLEAHHPCHFLQGWGGIPKCPQYQCMRARTALLVIACLVPLPSDG